MPFPFENLKAYQISLDWVEFAEQLCNASKNELTRAFIDQFQRAALSIPLNLAEGVQPHELPHLLDVFSHQPQVRSSQRHRSPRHCA